MKAESRNYCRGFGLALLFGGLLCAATRTPAADDKKDGKKPENSAVKPEQRKDPSATARHQTLLERTRTGPVDVLFLGDSITQGWETSGKDAWTRLFDSLNLKAVNLGVGGDRTQNVLWRLREGGELGSLKPKVVVLLVGTNNLNGNTVAEIAEGVGAIVQELRKQLPEAKVLLMGVFPRGVKATDLLRSQVKEVNQLLAKLADGKTVRFLAIGEEFLEKEGAKKDELSKDLLPDNVHLSPKGYQVWADALRKQLPDMLKETAK
jgi:lysophospholipase L1-like esterase